MSIESLKEQARTHEQKEEWGKAIDELEKDDRSDIGPYNRVADLQVRKGQLEDAVKNYEKAINLYIAAEPAAAVRTLKRALDVPCEVEDELLGIYYWLGHAHQQLGNKGAAAEFYDRVFSLDINFADVTERPRALR